MPAYDLPLAELEAYDPQLPTPTDLAAFWAGTLADSRAAASDPTYQPVDTGLAGVQTYDVTFTGFLGDPVRAWLHLPTGGGDALPVVVQYAGYGGGRGLAHEAGTWVLSGRAHLVVDTRGQGSGYSVGATEDPHGAGPAIPGYMTRGILDPSTYYYRRVFTDAVLAVDALRGLPRIDTSRVTITGGSQGGGITLAVAALRSDLVAAMPDVPFLCDFRRALSLIDTDPYAEITRYLKAHRDHVGQVFSTLAYFDCAVLSRTSSAPALFSVALMDQICPPSTVFAAYNAYAGPKDIRVYPFNDHEGGQSFQLAEQLRWLPTQDRLHGVEGA
jgi:cephalosporin-C deacetylase